jgi:antitoxin (DNA-binding transcriptional repressor) of toxin-antitoxin stability system
MESDNQILMKPDKSKKAGGQRKGRKSRSRIRGAVSSVNGRRVISATEVARSFSELLDRVCYRGETFVIERGGEPVCEMSPVKPLRFTGTDFLALLNSLPKPDPAFWDAVENATRQAPTVPDSPWEC